MQEGSVRLVGLGFPPFPLLVLWHKIMALFVMQRFSSSFLFDPEETVRDSSTLRAACALVSAEMLSGMPGSVGCLAHGFFMLWLEMSQHQRDLCCCRDAVLSDSGGISDYFPALVSA